MKAAWLGRGALVLILIAGIFPFLHKGTGGTSEFPVYTLGGERMLAGEEIYRTSDPKPFTYPPFFAVPFLTSPDVPMEPPRDALPFVGWYVITAIALVIVFLVVHRHLVRSEAGAGPPFAFLFYFLTLLFAGRFIASVFGNQSHDLLVFLPIMLALAAMLKERDGKAAAWLGLAAAFKATPLLFLGLFILQRRFTALGIMVGTVFVATLAPDLLFPRQDGNLWILAWLETFVFKLDPGGPADAGPWLAGNVLNQSLSGTMHRLLGETGPAWLTPLTQLAVLALVSVAILKRTDARFVHFAQFGAVVCGMVLLSPMSSKAHFCVLLLPVAVCVHDALIHRGRVSIAALATVFVIGTLTSKDLIGRELGNQLLAMGTVTWLTVTLLCAMTWHALKTHQSVPGTDKEGDTALA